MLAAMGGEHEGSDIYLGALFFYGLAITMRLGWSTVRGEGHEWGWWDGGGLLRGKRMEPGMTLFVFALTLAGVGAVGWFWLRGLGAI